EAQIEQVGAERTLELRRRLGEIALDHLSDQEEAERHLAWVLEQRPTDASTRDRLRGVFARSGRAKDEVELLATSAEASADVEVKRHLFFEMARIQERALEDPDAAIASVKRALDLDPEDREALEGASRLFREHRRFRPLVDILERRAVRAAPESEVALRFEIAEVVEKGIEDVPGAVEAYREVLRRQPNHEPTLEALERIHTERESWRDLVEILERRVAAEIDLRRRVDLLTRIASLREERFSDPQGAAASLLQALEEAPDDVATLGRLERVWRAEGEGEKLLETLERHRELVEAPEEVASLLLEMAPLREARGDREGAESALREFMEVAPNGREGPAGLGRLYASAERWPDALAMIEREIELVSEASEAAELHYRAGRLLADRMGEPDAARAAYERGVEADPGHGPSLRALRLVREAEGDFEDAIELEAREAESTEDLLERAGLYHHAAEAALERFDNVERAIEYLESGVASHPDHAPSLELLSELYFSEERWTDAEALLLRLVTRLDASEDRSELGRLHYRLAYIAEKNGDGPLALERYHASYERDSTYLPTLEGLAGALLRAERWEDAQRVYQAILIQHRSALTDAEVVDLHFQVGELAMRLEQLERARKSFNRVLDLDRSHVPTLGAFADLAEQEGHWEEAYELRERMLALLIDDGDRFAALLKQAELAERRIEEPWRAIDAYVEARRLRPDDVFVLRALVTLYRDTSQIPRALEVLGDLGLVLTEREDRRDVFLQMARLHH
ncbi:MAG: tetratricopeptide repeat protein, partial [Myxococcota bacterium]